MGGGGGGGQPPAPIPCDSLQFDATVTSVDEDVAQAVAPNDSLTVGLQPSGDQFNTVVLITDGGQVLGSLTTRVFDILRCLEDGATFQADVVEVEQELIRVQVHPSG